MAKKYGVLYSRLCVADKLAIALEPWWFYLPRVILSGEIYEYMARSRGKDAKYAHMHLATGTKRGWFRACTRYLRQWVDEHRDIKEDTWTPREA